MLELSILVKCHRFYWFECHCPPDLKNLFAPISIKGKDTSGIRFCLELSGTSGVKGVGKSCIWNISCSHFYVTGNGVSIIALGQVTA